MKILIKNGHVIDPDTKLDQVADVLLEDDKIQEVKENIKDKADRVIDARGCYVMPGLIDMHVHLRDPGLTHKEDVFTGSKAAARGGVTTLVAMPNTKPVIDNPERLSYVKNKAMQCNLVNVAPAISEDGKSVMNAQIYKEAMQIAARMNIPVLAHCEDIHMVNGGCMNEDTNSEKFGLPGICNAVEDTIVARDILIAKDTGCHLHLCHCSTKDSEVMLRLAKEEGISVSGEVCPHHFTLTSDDIVEGDTNYKMNPPLRTKEDRKALLEGLKNDVFDVISTDHAPHTMVEKGVSMKSAPFGIVGLETSVSLTITELVDKGWITPMQMAEKMSYNPAKVLGIDKGSLDEGKVADITIINPDEEYIIDVNEFKSKGRNTPFGGTKVSGKVKWTILGGKIVKEPEEK